MRSLSRCFKDEFASDVANTAKNVANCGVETKEYQSRGVDVFKARLSAGNSFGRPAGNYYTFEIQKYGEKVFQSLKILLGNAISELLPKKMRSILILGMGNAEIVSDALGIKTLEHIDIISLMETSDKRIAKFCPGVYSVSGIESFDVVKGLVGAVKPDAIIVVDSLCTQDLGRLGRSFQISDAGIIPGSAVGSELCNLSRETLGRSVVSVGVPVVVYLKYIMENAINKSTPNQTSDWSAEDLRLNFDAIFSPKDIDYIISRASRVIADSIIQAIVT